MVTGQSGTGLGLESQQGALQITLGDEGWTTFDLIDLLRRINTAYERLNAFFSSGSEPIPRLFLGTKVWPYSRSSRLGGRQAADQELHNLVQSALEITSPLQIDKIEIGSPGFLALIGSLNPLKVIADLITSWRHENSAREKVKLDDATRRMEIRAELAKAIIERMEPSSLPTLHSATIAQYIDYTVEEPIRILEGVAEYNRVEDTTVKELTG